MRLYIYRYTLIAVHTVDILFFFLFTRTHTPFQFVQLDAYDDDWIWSSDAVYINEQRKILLHS